MLACYSAQDTLGLPCQSDDQCFNGQVCSDAGVCAEADGGGSSGGTETDATDGTASSSGSSGTSGSDGVGTGGTGSSTSDGTTETGDGTSGSTNTDTTGSGTSSPGETTTDDTTGTGQTTTSGTGDTTTSDTGTGTGATEVIAIAAGGHTCALLDTNEVRCWGSSSVGQLGYGNTQTIGDNETPAAAGDVDVGGIVTQITVASGHACALRLAGGSVRCWGYGLDGRLGYGNTEDIGDDETPASAGDVDIGWGVAQVTGGQEHTCARLEIGAVRCWGRGAGGQLGYGNFDSVGDNETPAAVGNVDVGAAVMQVAAGGAHTCAVVDDLVPGRVRCWGTSGYGQLGYGNTDTIGDNETPASAGNVDVGVVAALSTGHWHTCALMANDAVRCWGSSQWGQLGYGDTESIGDNETPMSVGEVDVGGAASQIAAGNAHTCALLDGNVRCWGYGIDGRLGYGNTAGCASCADGPACCIGDDETPASAGDVPVF